MHPSYPRAELQRRILERIEAGWTLDQLEREPGFPSRQTVFRWAAEDAGFAQRLKDARAWRRGERAQARVAPSFNEPVAETLLARVRQGEAIRDLVKEPLMPGRDQLDRWKRERPDFAARLEEAWRFAASVREKRRWVRFDQGAADAIVLRVSKGEPMPQVLDDPALPGATAVRRWKRMRPDFAGALEAAKLAGHRVRMRARSKRTPELEVRLHRLLLDGLSLHAICRLRSMPHYVTLRGWLRRDPEFARQVRISERFRNDLMQDAMLDAARAVSTPDEAGDVRRGLNDVSRRLGRMAPKRRA